MTAITVDAVRWKKMSCDALFSGKTSRRMADRGASAGRPWTSRRRARSRRSVPSSVEPMRDQRSSRRRRADRSTSGFAVGSVRTRRHRRPSCRPPDRGSGLLVAEARAVAERADHEEPLRLCRRASRRPAAEIVVRFQCDEVRVTSMTVAGYFPTRPVATTRSRRERESVEVGIETRAEVDEPMGPVQPVGRRPDAGLAHRRGPCCGCRSRRRRASSPFRSTSVVDRPTRYVRGGRPGAVGRNCAVVGAGPGEAVRRIARRLRRSRRLPATPREPTRRRIRVPVATTWSTMVAAARDRLGEGGHLGPPSVGGLGWRRLGEDEPPSLPVGRVPDRRALADGRTGRDVGAAVPHDRADPVRAGDARRTGEGRHRAGRRGDPPGGAESSPANQHDAAHREGRRRARRRGQPSGAGGAVAAPRRRAGDAGSVTGRLSVPGLTATTTGVVPFRFTTAFARHRPPVSTEVMGLPRTGVSGPGRPAGRGGSPERPTPASRARRRDVLVRS